MKKWLLCPEKAFISHAMIGSLPVNKFHKTSTGPFLESFLVGDPKLHGWNCLNNEPVVTPSGEHVQVAC